jgi:hypothetical protein
MTRDEYEARRRRLDEELRAAIEMLKAGHQAQVQALDLLWRISTGGAAAPDPFPVLPSAAPKSRRRGPGELLQEVIAILPQLPEPFTKDDVSRALPDPPDRSSLFRVLQELEMTGRLRVESYGSGRLPTVYRREPPRTSTTGPRNAAEP